MLETELGSWLFCLDHKQPFLSRVGAWGRAAVAKEMKGKAHGKLGLARATFQG